MKRDSKGNKYDYWGIAERARGFVIPGSLRYTRTEAIEHFEKDTGYKWSELKKNYEAVRVKVEVVRTWRPTP